METKEEFVKDQNTLERERFFISKTRACNLSSDKKVIETIKMTEKIENLLSKKTRREKMEHILIRKEVRAKQKIDDLAAEFRMEMSSESDDMNDLVMLSPDRTKKRRLKRKIELDSKPKKRSVLRSATNSNPKKYIKDADRERGEESDDSSSAIDDSFIVDNDVIEFQSDAEDGGNENRPIIYYDDNLIMPSFVKQKDAFYIYVDFLANVIMDETFSDQVKKTSEFRNYFMPAVNKIEKKLNDDKNIVVTSSSAWNSLFTDSIDLYPYLITSENIHGGDCEACGRSNHPATQQIKLSGQEYDSQLLWRESKYKVGYDF